MSHEPHVPNVHEDALRAYGLTYPGATEDSPWGHIALKVKGKTFAWLNSDAVNGFGITVKLPESRDGALMMPFATPTGYGLGKSGWVSCNFRQDQTPPVDILKKWMDESYRAVAPKKLVEQLQAQNGQGRTMDTSMKTEKPATRKSTGTRKQHGDKLGAATKKAAAKKKPSGGRVASKVKAAVKKATPKKAAKKKVR